LSVDPKQRFTAESPCPVCGGHDGDPRGNGVRCYGFLSDDGVFAHCSREEYAGEAAHHEGSQTYSHLLVGSCSCGKRHGEPSSNGRGEIAATYDYVDLAGELVHQTIRYEPKSFAQRRPDGSGGWIWSLKGIEPVIYRLPEVLEAIRAGHPVLICEGEKDVETARELGFTATTCAMGAKKWRKSFDPYFRGAEVTLVPHNDAAGKEHMAAVGRQLLSVAKSVKILELPNVPEDGGDLTDWRDAGGSRGEFEDLLSSSSDTPIYAGDDDKNLEPEIVWFHELGKPKPRHYIIEKIGREGFPVIVYGAGGVAKSFAVLAYGVAAAGGGGEWLGLRVLQHGYVLYVDFELEVNEQHNRVVEVCNGLGVEVPRRLAYLSGVGFSREETFAKARQFVKEYSPVAVIIDSIGQAMPGDMDKNKDVNAFFRDFIDPFRPLGTTPILVDHEGKRQAGEKHRDKSPIGGVYKTNNARSVLQFILEEYDKETATSSIRVRIHKINFEPPDPFGFYIRFESGKVTLTPRKLEDTELLDEERIPLRDRILGALQDDSATIPELSRITGATEGSIRNKLSEMMREEPPLITSDNRRPKTYSILSSSPPPGGSDDDDKSGEGVGGEELASETTLVATPEGLNELVHDLGPAPILGVDVETYPRDETARSLDPRRGHIGVISLAAEGSSYVIDRKALSAGEVREALVEVLSGKPIIAHNAPFDLQFLRRDVGYEHDGQVFDTLVLDAMYFYATGPLAEKKNDNGEIVWRGFVQKDKEEGYRKSLADVAEKWIGVEMDKTAQSADWGGELSEEMISYADLDAAVLLPLRDALVSELEALGMGPVVDLEARFTPSMAYCSDNGFALDVEGWRHHAAKMEETLAEAKAELDRLAPEVPPGVKFEEWKWGTSDHRRVGLALELVGAKVDKRERTGNYITDEAALKAIKRPKKAKELAEAILRYREADKVVTTWGNSWFKPPEVVSRGPTKGKVKQGSPQHLRVIDGRAYSTFNQLVATGRGSSRDPNFQNIPPNLRRFFKAPPGRKLLIADYSQVEYCTAAFLAGDEALLGPIRDGVDFHEATAQLIGTDRATAKTVNFALLYGMGVPGLAGKLGCSKERAQEYIDAVRRRAPALAAWCDERRSKADLGTPYAKTPLGRIRLVDQNYRRFEDSWRSNYSQLLNHPVQGGTADAYKFAAAMVWERRGEFTGAPLLVNMVHDELILEVDASTAEAGARLLERIMLEGIRATIGDAPVKVDVKVSERWEKD